LEIINERFLLKKVNSSKDINIFINPKIILEEGSFIIKELMVKFSEVFYIDYIIKFPYNYKKNEINLKDIIFVKLKHLNQKNNISIDEMDKYNKKRNIISSYTDVKNHKINIIHPIKENYNNSLIEIKKYKNIDFNDIKNYDSLPKNKKIELPNIEKKKSKIFKKINFNISNDIQNNNESNQTDNLNFKENNLYNCEEYMNGNSKDDSQKFENFINNSYLLKKNMKDFDKNTIGKNYNDYNAKEINKFDKIINDFENLKSYKDKKISPNTAPTEKSNKRLNYTKNEIYYENEIGRDLYNLK